MFRTTTVRFNASIAAIPGPESTNLIYLINVRSSWRPANSLEMWVYLNTRMTFFAITRISDVHFHVEINDRNWRRERIIDMIFCIKVIHVVCSTVIIFNKNQSLFTINMLLSHNSIKPEFSHVYLLFPKELFCLKRTCIFT